MLCSAASPFKISKNLPGRPLSRGCYVRAAASPFKISKNLPDSRMVALQVQAAQAASPFKISKNLPGGRRLRLWRRYSGEPQVLSRSQRTFQSQTWAPSIRTWRPQVLSRSQRTFQHAPVAPAARRRRRRKSFQDLKEPSRRRSGRRRPRPARAASPFKISKNLPGSPT